MLLSEIFDLDCLTNTKLVTPGISIERPVRWVHVVDLPDLRPWVKPDQLVLTTGYSLPTDAAERKRFIHQAHESGVSAIMLAVPMRFDHVPADMIEEAVRLELPLFEIPWEIPFVEVTEQVHRLLIAEQHAVIERSETVHRLLSESAVTHRTLADLCQLLGELLHRSVIIEAADMTVLASHSIDGMDDVARLETLARGASSLRYVQHLEDLGWSDKILHITEAIRIPGNEDGTITARVVCSIRLLKELIGYIWIVEGEHELSELDIRAADHASVLAAVHIAHQREITALEHKVGAGFLDSILEGRYSASPSVLERAQLRGFSETQPYRLFMAVLPESLPISERGLLERDRIASDIRSRLRSINLAQLITQNLNRIFVLVPVEFNLVHFADIVSHHDLAGVVSAKVVGPAEIREAYKQLQRIEKHLRPGAIQHHRDFLVPRVLHGDVEAHRDLIEAVIAPLERAGRGSSLVQTLNALVNCNFVLSQTAEALAIHVSTLRYRVERIEELLGVSFSDHQARYAIQTACYLLNESLDAPVRSS